MCYTLQVHDLVMAAVLAAEPELHSAARMHVPHRSNCFEVSVSYYQSYSLTAVCKDLFA